MTTFAPSARPPWAVVAWADERAVYIELPVTNGPAYIQKFPLTEGGLAKALKVMIDAHFRFKVPGTTRTFTMDEHPRITRAKPKYEVTDAQRAKALEFVKRMKLGRKGG